jgi:uncharacterized protein involved in response to NO
MLPVVAKGLKQSVLALFSDVHRPFFLGGGIFAIVSISLWLLNLTGITPYAWVAVQKQIHMTQMIYFFFPFFFFGFLLTIFPRLLSVSAVPFHVVVLLFLLYFGGAVIFTAGIYAGTAWVRAGALLAALSFALLTFWLLRIFRQSTYPHKFVPAFMLAGIVFGFIGMLMLVYFTFTADTVSGRIAEAIGLYGFLLPTIYAVSYRMVPIFTAVAGRDVTRDRYGLPLVFAFSLLRMFLTAADLYEFYWLADTGLFCVITHQLWRWRIWQPKAHAIQAILHWAMAWLPLAFLLAAVTSFTAWLTGGRWLVIEQAALHALVIGGFGTLLLGMVTRVTLGHAGFSVITDRYTTMLFYGFQLIPVMRVGSGLLGEVLPKFSMIGIYMAGFAWVLFFVLWGWRYLPIYLKGLP